MRHSALNFGSVGSLLSATLLIGCGADGPPIRSFEALGEAVTGGELSPALESVLKLRGSGAACSASLVAPNLILTAMHCVAPIAIDVDYECKYNGDIVKGRAGAGAFTKVADPDEISLQGGATPGAVLAIGSRIFTTNSEHICKDDLALVVLDRNLDLPLLPLRLDAATVEDEPMKIVGYGTTGVTGDDIARRERTGVLVEQVGGEAGTTVRSAAPPRTFTVGPSACPGDSGGPAISENSGAVAGLYSIGLNKCTDSNALNIYTRLAPFRGLILAAFEAAENEPWFEGEDGPGFPATPVPTASAAPTEPAPSLTSAPSAAPSAAPPKPTATTPAPRPTAKPPTSDAGVLEEETDEPTAGRRLSSGCNVVQAPRLSYAGWLLAAAVAGTAQLRRRRSASLG